MEAGADSFFDLQSTVLRTNTSADVDGRARTILTPNIQSEKILLRETARALQQCGYFNSRS